MFTCVHDRLKYDSVIKYQGEGASLQAALAQAHNAALSRIHGEAPPLRGVGSPGC